MTTQIVFWLGWFVLMVVLWSIVLAVYLKG